MHLLSCFDARAQTEVMKLRHENETLLARAAQVVNLHEYIYMIKYKYILVPGAQ